MRRDRSAGRDCVEVVPAADGFVGVNQWLYVLVGVCPASLFLRCAFGLRSVAYENDRAAARGQEVRA